MIFNIKLDQTQRKHCSVQKHLNLDLKCFVLIRDELVDASIRFAGNSTTGITGFTVRACILQQPELLVHMDKLLERKFVSHVSSLLPSHFWALFSMLP